jgi:NUMOD1 domain
LDMASKNRNNNTMESVSRPVYQYTLDGKRNNVFESVLKAAKASGGSPEYIKIVADGQGLSSAKFHWSWEDRPFINLKSKREELIAERRKRYGLRLSQYDLQGKRLAKYYSVQEAALATGVSVNAIREVVKKKAHFLTAGGFYWQKGFGKVKIDLSNYKWGNQSAGEKSRRPIIQLSLDGKQLQTFKSVTEAARAMNCTAGQLSNVCNGRAKTCKGFKWRLA